MSESLPDQPDSNEVILKVGHMLTKFSSEFEINDAFGRMLVFPKAGLEAAGVYDTDDPTEVDMGIIRDCLIDPKLN